MIDWASVAFNAVWIAGLSIILAAFSYHSWLAGVTGRALRAALNDRSWKLSFSTGMLMTCVGLGYGLTWNRWVTALWTALGVSYAYQLLMSLRER